jgi:molecular chaperone GrpE
MRGGARLPPEFINTKRMTPMTDNTESTPAAPDAENLISAQLDALHARLAEAEATAAGAKDYQMRTAAELDNVRKRAEREIETAKKYGAERVLGDLLAIIDSLELGLKAASVQEATVQSIAEGMALTHKQLLGFFERYGVAQVDPAGQPFNPQLHEAVSAVPSVDVAPNHVLSVMQKGYRLHERLLRPAMVVVAKAPAE